MTTVRDFLNDYSFADNDTVFLCQYGSRKTTKSMVKDIPTKVQRKELYIVQPHFGGIDYDYNSYRLIYKK